jgi:hypothetical protein
MIQTSGIKMHTGKFSLWSRRNLMVVAAWSFLFSTLVAVISVIRKREYIATAEFLLQEPSAAMSGQGLAQLASQFGVSPMTGSGPTGFFYAEWVRSFEIMREAASSRYAALGGGPKSDLYTYFELEAGDLAADAMMVKELRKHVRTRFDRSVSTVRIDVQLPNAALASELGRRLIDILNKYAAQRRMTSGRAEREFVGRRLAEARDSLAAVELEYATFIKVNRRIQESPTLMLLAERLQRRIQQNQAVIQTLVQNYEAARVQEVRDTPVISIVQRPEAAVEPIPRGTIFLASIAFVLATAFQLAWQFRHLGRNGPSSLPLPVTP